MFVKLLKLLSIVLLCSTILFGCGYSGQKNETIPVPETNDVVDRHTVVNPIIETPVPQTEEVVEIEDKQNTNQEVVEIEDEQNTNQGIALNTPIIVQYFGEDAFEMKILSVEYTDYRNRYYDGIPVDSVVVVTVEGINISDEAQYLSDSYFNCYGEDGTKLNLYPAVIDEYSSIEELNPNRKAVIAFAFGVQKGTKVELEVVNVGDDKPLGSIFFE